MSNPVKLGARVRDLRTNRIGIFCGWLTHCGQVRAYLLIDGRRAYPLRGEVVLMHKRLSD